jgi:hypothetical protein
MNIQSTQRPLRTHTGKTNSKPVTNEQSDNDGADNQQDEVNSAFSVDRDLAYAIGATIAQVPRAIVSATGPLYGVPQIAATAVGGVLAVAGAKEIMTNTTLRGRINGGIHLAVGAMAAAAPWTGDLAGKLYLTSLAALGVKAMLDQPGNILKTVAKETGSMVGEVLSDWSIDSK